MRFRIKPLEPRILLDAALVAVVVDAVSDDASDFADGGADSDFISPDDAATPDDALLAEVALSTDSVRLLVVSSQVADYAVLGAAAQDSVEVVHYDFAQDSLIDIVDAIETQLNGRLADSVAFATEGRVGEFFLTDDAQITLESLNDSDSLQAFWKDIASNVLDGGRIDLLACDVASGAVGVELVEALDSLFDTDTRAIDIAASSDLTGHSDLGGDWTLEYGAIDATTYFESSELGKWTAVLAEEAGASDGGAASGSGTATGAATGATTGTTTGTSTATTETSVVTEAGEDSPSVTSDGGGESAAILLDENLTEVTTVTASDADLPADTLAFSITGGADMSKFDIDSTTGVLTFLVAPDFENPTDAEPDNTYDVQVTVTDFAGAVDTQDIAVTIRDANEAPAITSDGGGDSAGIDASEAQTAVTTVTATDPELPDDTLTFSISGGVDQAMFTIDSDTGVLTFTNTPLYEAPVDFDEDNVYEVQVTVTDSGTPGLTDTQDISVFVYGVPAVVEVYEIDPISTSEVNSLRNTPHVGTAYFHVDGVLQTDLLYFVTGVDATLFNIDDLTGDLYFDRAPNYEDPMDDGMDNVYEVEIQGYDGTSYSAIGIRSFQVTVLDVFSEAPIAFDDSAAVLADSTDNSINVLGNDVTTDASDLYIAWIDDQQLNQPGINSSQGGTVIENPYDPSGESILYTPPPDFVGVDTIFYDVAGEYGIKDRGVVIVSVGSPPEITSDGGGDSAAIDVTENQTAVTTVEATVPDLPGDTLTFTISGGADQGKFAIDSGTGVLTFLMAPDFENPTDSDADNTYDVQVTVTDSIDLTDTQDLAVTVINVNNPPVLDPIGNQSVDEGSQLSFTATATDGDDPANTLTFSLLGAVPPGASITPTGVFTWTPTEAQGPDDYTFNVMVSETNGSPTNLSASETITVTVNEVNTRPVLAGIGDQTVDEGSLLTFTATAADNDDPANALTFSLLGSVPSGASITPSGVFTWTPTEAQGPDDYSFDVVVTDNGTGNLMDSETIIVTVNEVNAPPVLAPIGTRSIQEGSLLTFTATATDTDDPANALTFSLSGMVPSGASIAPSTGVFIWTPTEAQGPGDYTFDVVVTDNGTGNLLDSETITVTVSEVNQAPVLAPIGNQTVNEGELLTFTATATDGDLPDNTLTFSLGAGAPAGAAITSDGLFTYTPDDGPGGPFMFDVVVTDNGTPQLSAFETIAVTVFNLAPVTDNETYTVNEDGVLTVAEVNGVLVGDTDVLADQPGLAAALNTGPANGTATMQLNGSFVYTPNPNFNGVDTFTYRSTDKDGGIGIGTVTITVLPVNDAPNANDDMFIAPEFFPYNGDVSLNDNDTHPGAPDENSPLMFNVVTPPTFGTLTLTPTGQFVYTGDFGFDGLDTFQYVANDGTDDSAVATVSITVDNSLADPTVSISGEEPRGPTLPPPIDFGDDNSPITEVSFEGIGERLVYESKDDGGVLRASGGSIRVNADGSFTFAPRERFSGDDVISFEAGEEGKKVTLSLAVRVYDDAFNIFKAVNSEGDIFAEDRAFEEIDKEMALVYGPQHGELKLNSDGTFTYVPDPDYEGSDSFSYDIVDEKGAVVSTSTVDVDVGGEETAKQVIGE